MNRYEFLVHLLEGYRGLHNMSTRNTFETLHHFEHMCYAYTHSQYYCPTPKGHAWDASLFDKITDKLTLSLEYKYKHTDNILSYKQINIYLKEYGVQGKNIDILDIGFSSRINYEKHLEKISTFEMPETEHIIFKLTDFSLYFKPEALDLDFMDTSKFLFHNQQLLDHKIMILSNQLPLLT